MASIAHEHPTSGIRPVLFFCNEYSEAIPDDDISAKGTAWPMEAWEVKNQGLLNYDRRPLSIHPSDLLRSKICPRHFQRAFEVQMTLRFDTIQLFHGRGSSWLVANHQSVPFPN